MRKLIDWYKGLRRRWQVTIAGAVFLLVVGALTPEGEDESTAVEPSATPSATAEAASTTTPAAPAAVTRTATPLATATAAEPYPVAEDVIGSSPVRRIRVDRFPLARRPARRR